MISQEEVCVCKGIRVCSICEKTPELLQRRYCRSQKPDPPRIVATWTYQRCYDCKLGWLTGETYDTHVCTGTEDARNESTLDVVNPTQPPPSVSLPNISVKYDFLDESSEHTMMEAIDSNPWVVSQSGRRKQDYGPMVNFKKQKLKMGNYTGLPSYAKSVMEKLNSESGLTDFVGVELGVIEYTPERGSCIDPHIDDAWAWGERITIISLQGDTVMTFAHNIPVAPRHDSVQRENEQVLPNIDGFIQVVVRAPLPARSLLVVQGPARHLWTHAILREDITSRRISATFRELAPDFLPGAPLKEIGATLVKMATAYEGEVSSRPTI